MREDVEIQNVNVSSFKIRKQRKGRVRAKIEAIRLPVQDSSKGKHVVPPGLLSNGHTAWVRGSQRLIQELLLLTTEPGGSQYRVQRAASLPSPHSHLVTVALTGTP